MKKRNITLTLIAMLLAGCNNTTSSSTSNTPSAPISNESNVISSSGDEQILNPTIIAPNGTPMIAMSNYFINHMDTLTKASGAQELVGAFGNEEMDMIVAPINLGALRFSAKKTYGLYKTLVYDNLYIVSKEEIHTPSDLQGKDITNFSSGSTPQVVLDTILKKNKVTANVTYASNVVNANAMFESGESDIIISAQPNVTSLKKDGVYIKPLISFWKEATGLDTYPQAGLFVKISEFARLKTALEEIDAGYELLSKDVSASAKNAHEVTGTFPEAMLKNVIPQCGYKVEPNGKKIVTGYYQALIDLGLAKNIGGKLPDEDFYLTNK